MLLLLVIEPEDVEEEDDDDEDDEEDDEVAALIVCQNGILQRLRPFLSLSLFSSLTTNPSLQRNALFCFVLLCLFKLDTGCRFKPKIFKKKFLFFSLSRFRMNTNNSHVIF